MGQDFEMIVVIADDITGAAEIAGVCLHYDLRIRFDFDAELNEIPDANVWIIATDTRSLSEADACQTMEKIASFLAIQRQNRVYNISVFKKIDSALRGHILPEINVLLKYLPQNKTFILPANPENGRTVKNGIYYIDGQPLNQTSFANDPDFPATTSVVKDLIGLQDEEKFVIPDITTITDYQRYAKLLTPDILPAGSAIFFESILQNQQLEPSKQKFESFEPKSCKKLMLCGSTHENSSQFIRNTHNFNKLNLVETATTATALQLLAESKPVLIYAPNKQTLNNYNPQEIKRKMAKICQILLESGNVNELLIEGGSTACACLHQCGISTLIPVSEYARGVVRMAVFERKGLYITLKPGSYTWAPECLQ